LSILADSRDATVACLLLPIGRKRDSQNGLARKFQEDPHWRELILFYEYFHGDNGAGLGASHQTGWTGIIARSMHLFATTTAEQILQLGKMAPVIEVQKPGPGSWQTSANRASHQPGWTGVARIILPA
jgi:hypothetical protein